MYVIAGGAVFVKGNDAPTDGRNSRFITVFFDTNAGTVNEICCCCCDVREDCAEPAPFSRAMNCGELLDQGGVTVPEVAAV